MPSGLQVFNAAGTVSVDQDYANYHLVGVFPVYCGTPSSVAYYGTLTVPGGNIQDMVGVYGPAWACLSYTGQANGGSSYRIAKTGGAGWVNVLVFSPSMAASGSNVGLQVFKADGSLAFDSGRPYMRIIDFITGGEVVRSYPGKTVGLIQCERAYDFQDNPVGQPPFFDFWLYTYSSSMMYTDGSTARTAYQNLEAYQNPESTNAYGGAEVSAYLVVDLTGMV